MKSLVAALWLGSWPSNLIAQVLVIEVPYEEVASLPGTLIDFNDKFPTYYPRVIGADGVSFGERFLGQVILQEKDALGIPHDKIGAQKPDLPLTLLAGEVGENLIIKENGDNDTPVLAPVGPAGWTKKAGVGEGTLALKFDELVCAMGFRASLEGRKNGYFPNPLHTDNLKVTFYSDEGATLAYFAINKRAEEIYSFGFKVAEDESPWISGVLIQNLDVEGVAFDDFVFSGACARLIG